MTTTIVYKKPACIEKASTFCPGCTHGTINQLVASSMEEMGIVEDAIMVVGVGCSTTMNIGWSIDALASEHGRAPAVATGVKRMNPDKFVFTYQGDGDLAAIGTAEIVHAAHRGEKLSVIYVNNTIYGMTGGQMAPTTLSNQITTTSPYGRDPKTTGNPIRMAELLATIDGCKFAERVSVDTPGNLMRAKKAIRRSFECQQKNIGFSIVEILAACPTNWGKSAPEALEWLRENMIPYYPIGNIKDFNG